MFRVYGGYGHGGNYTGDRRVEARPLQEHEPGAPGPVKIIVRDGVKLAMPQLIDPLIFGSRKADRRRALDFGD